MGRATALAFARDGAKVAVADIAMSGAEETLLLVRQAGGEGIALAADVTKSGDVRAMIERIVSGYGRLD